MHSAESNAMLGKAEDLPASASPCGTVVADTVRTVVVYTVRWGNLGGSTTFSHQSYENTESM